jgi:hypothetical protein
MGETPQQKKFRKQVKSQVSDTSTEQDVLKAAGLKQLPGTAVSSTPPAKETVTGQYRPMGAKHGVPGVHPGIKKTPMEVDEIERGAKIKSAAEKRKHPGMQKMVDAMRAAGLSEQKITQYLSVQYSAGPGAGRRAERREKFLRRQAAEKYGTPP